MKPSKFKNENKRTRILGNRLAKHENPALGVRLLSGNCLVDVVLACRPSFRKGSCVRPVSLAGLLILSSFWSCEPSKWEDVTSDHEPVLNVFGLISMDERTPSFVVVHQTLGLDGPDQEIVGYDTAWYGDGPDDYWVYPRYESRYLVKNANVVISQGEHEYQFAYVADPYKVNPSWWNYDFVRGGAIYLDTVDSFTAVPNAVYTLRVSTPDGRISTGQLTTPPIPEIYAGLLPDTLHSKIPYTISWRPMANNVVIVKTRTNHFICGSEHWEILERGESSWTSPVPRCRDEWWGYEQQDTLEIRLMALDDNYYEYFVKHSHDNEFVNFILGGGSSGLTYGVQGSFGVFGSIATDRISRVLVP